MLLGVYFSKWQQEPNFCTTRCLIFAGTEGNWTMLTSMKPKKLVEGTSAAFKLLSQKSWLGLILQAKVLDACLGPVV